MASLGMLAARLPGLLASFCRETPEMACDRPPTARGTRRRRRRRRIGAEDGAGDGVAHRGEHTSKHRSPSIAGRTRPRVESMPPRGDAVPVGDGAVPR